VLSGFADAHLNAHSISCEHLRYKHMAFVLHSILEVEAWLRAALQEQL
jgi:hypothetical protein